MEVEHIAWQVRDPVAVAAWYGEHLGFTVKRRGKGPALAHFIADTSGRVILEIYHHAHVPVPDYAAMSPLALHLAFAVPDVTAVRDRLVRAGATVAEDITVTHAGDELAMLRDPWGFPIQFLRRAERMI